MANDVDKSSQVRAEYISRKFPELKESDFKSREEYMAALRTQYKEMRQYEYELICQQQTLDMYNLSGDKSYVPNVAIWKDQREVLRQNLYCVQDSDYRALGKIPGVDIKGSAASCAGTATRVNNAISERFGYKGEERFYQAYSGCPGAVEIHNNPATQKYRHADKSLKVMIDAGYVGPGTILSVPSASANSGSHAMTVAEVIKDEKGKITGIVLQGNNNRSLKYYSVNNIDATLKAAYNKTGKSKNPFYVTSTQDWANEKIETELAGISDAELEQRVSAERGTLISSSERLATIENTTYALPRSTYASIVQMQTKEIETRIAQLPNKEIEVLCMVTPTYVSQLRRALGGEAKMMNSRECKEWIASLDRRSPEYQAISKLAERGLKNDTNPVEVKLAIANIAKDYREVKPEEINNLFENTPALVYHVQKEFGTQKAGGIRVTSELHEYYNNLPPDSPERKAIDELAMAHIEVSEAYTPKLDAAIQVMAYNHKPDRGPEPKPAVSLPKISLEMDNILVSPSLKRVEERNAVRAGFAKMDEQTWEALVDDYMKSTREDDNGQTKEELRQQRNEANQRFEAVLQSCLANDGNVDSKAVMKQSRKLLGEYLELEDGTEKSLDGFIRFVESSTVEDVFTRSGSNQVYPTLNPAQLKNRGGR